MREKLHTQVDELAADELEAFTEFLGDRHLGDIPFLADYDVTTHTEIIGRLVSLLGEYERAISGWRLEQPHARNRRKQELSDKLKELKGEVECL